MWVVRRMVSLLSSELLAPGTVWPPPNGGLTAGSRTANVAAICENSRVICGFRRIISDASKVRISARNYIELFFYYYSGPTSKLLGVNLGEFPELPVPAIPGAVELDVRGPLAWAGLLLADRPVGRHEDHILRLDAIAEAGAEPLLLRFVERVMAQP